MVLSLQIKKEDNQLRFTSREDLGNRPLRFDRISIERYAFYSVMKFLAMKSNSLINEIIFVTCLFIFCLLVGCGGGGGTTTPPPTVSKIDISPASLTLAKTGSQQFTAIARDAGGVAISGMAFKWSSNAPNIISIDSNGLASGVAEGTATISA